MKGSDQGAARDSKSQTIIPSANRPLYSLTQGGRKMDGRINLALSSLLQSRPIFAEEPLPHSISWIYYLINLFMTYLKRVGGGTNPARMGFPFLSPRPWGRLDKGLQGQGLIMALAGAEFAIGLGILATFYRLILSLNLEYKPLNLNIITLSSFRIYGVWLFWYPIVLHRVVLLCS
ncbi:hypothetical protein F4809DRAFT_589141 [Biscogniauxia mediterranea]|nr:hypothetical protein F4809DRAFT_589141 [Biscogniauxia mediterranea]